MSYIIASLLGFGLGPGMHAVLVSQKKWRQLLDGFIATSILGLVFLHILPEFLEEAGDMAVVFILASIFIPFLLRKVVHTQHKGMGFVLFLFILHILVESVAIASGEGEHHGLGMAIVLHRFPVAMLWFSYFSQRKGTGYALSMIFLFWLCSVLGFALGSQLHHFIPHTLSHLLEAFIAVSMLHVVLNEHHSLDEDTDGNKASFSLAKWGNRYANLGALLGVGLIVSVVGYANVSNFGKSFLRLSLGSAPVLLLAYSLAGFFATQFILQEFIEEEKGHSIQKKISGSIRFGFGELFDRTLPWLMLAILLAAALPPITQYTHLLEATMNNTFSTFSLQEYKKVESLSLSLLAVLFVFSVFRQGQQKTAK